jgi:hypothetical protein
VVALAADGAVSRAPGRFGEVAAVAGLPFVVGLVHTETRAITRWSIGGTPIDQLLHHSLGRDPTKARRDTAATSA